jgi:AraC-like DNA-binding protein
VLTYHLVMSGEGWLEVEGQNPIPLKSGDLVILARGDRHSVRDSSDSAVVPLEKLLSTHPLDAQGNLVIHGSGPESVFLCGGIMLEDARANPLVYLLPPVLHVNVGDESWLMTLVAVLEKESQSEMPGRNALVNHLGGMLFVAAMRKFLAGDPRMPAVASALGDRRITRASLLMIREPEREWNVSALADRVGMSRNGLARLFTLRVQMSPGSFLRRCRVARALALIRDQRCSLKDVSASVGYASTPAFSRAFKSVLGVTPGEFRANGRGRPIAIDVVEGH